MHNFNRAQMGYGQFGGGEFEFSPGQSVFNENEQMELAAELLEVSSDAEMDQFLGDLISKAGKAIGKFVSSPTGQAIGGVLKGAAKQLLPVAGQALGGFLGGSTGSQLGGQLGSAASDMFEAEAEEREWEAANSFVKLAADAVKHATEAPAGNPMAVAKQAVAQAAQTHAPELMAQGKNGSEHRGQGMEGGESGAKSGRWIRHHNRIVLIGA